MLGSATSAGHGIQVSGTWTFSTGGLLALKLLDFTRHAAGGWAPWAALKGINEYIRNVF